MALALAPTPEERPSSTLPALTRQQVISTCTHPFYTFDFPTPEQKQDDQQEAHERMWATCWRLYDRAEHDSRFDLRDGFPASIWSAPTALINHALFLAESAVLLNLDYLDREMNLTNDRRRYKPLYAVFYVAAYICALSHMVDRLLPEQVSTLEQIRASFFIAVPFEVENDRIFARQLLQQLPDARILVGD
jgi:hypothetical protein